MMNSTARKRLAENATPQPAVLAKVQAYLTAADKFGLTDNDEVDRIGDFDTMTANVLTLHDLRQLLVLAGRA